MVNIKDLSGITWALKDLNPVEIHVGNIICKAYNKLKDMHGNRIAIFKIVDLDKQLVDYDNQIEYSFVYDYFDMGFCLGDRIFLLRNNEHHLIDLITFEFFYVPEEIISEDVSIRWSLRVSV